jgi:hypothetical protein
MEVLAAVGGPSHYGDAQASSNVPSLGDGLSHNAIAPKVSSEHRVEFIEPSATRVRWCRWGCVPLVSSMSPGHRAGEEPVGTPSSVGEVESRMAPPVVDGASSGCSEEGDHPKHSSRYVGSSCFFCLRLRSLFRFFSDFLGQHVCAMKVGEGRDFNGMGGLTIPSSLAPLLLGGTVVVSETSGSKIYVWRGS